jgi:hypothetical protein
MHPNRLIIKIQQNSINYHHHYYCSYTEDEDSPLNSAYGATIATILIALLVSLILLAFFIKRYLHTKVNIILNNNSMYEVNALLTTSFIIRV